MLPRNDTKMAAPVLELKAISRSFADGSIHAVKNVSLDVHPGEIVSILGPSGCGKTTTMRMIAGLDEPNVGDIRIFGKSVLGQAPHRRNIGLVFQSLAVFPHMSVQRNVSFGLRMRKMPRQVIEEKVARALDLVQLPLDTFGERMPGQLSGGQLQRVALARTIVTEPALVLFDEPMAALDRRLRDYMAGELRAIQKQLNVAAIYVTHDQETASMMSDRIAIMNGGEIVQVGTPVEVYQRPKTRFVAEFLGDLNCLRARSVASAASPDAIELAGAVLRSADPAGPAGRDLSLLIRPEHVSLSLREPRPGCLRGEIIAAQFVSGVYRYRIRLTDGQELAARAPADFDEFANGKGQVFLEINPHHALIARD